MRLLTAAVCLLTGAFAMAADNLKAFPPAEPGMEGIAALVERPPGQLAGGDQPVVEIARYAHRLHLLDADMHPARRVGQDDDRRAQRPQLPARPSPLSTAGGTLTATRSRRARLDSVRNGSVPPRREKRCTSSASPDSMDAVQGRSPFMRVSHAMNGWRTEHKHARYGRPLSSRQSYSVSQFQSFRSVTVSTLQYCLQPPW